MSITLKVHHFILEIPHYILCTICFIRHLVPKALSRALLKLTNSPHSEDRTDTVLFTLPYSHYCEKVRWALDLSNEKYTETKVVPNLLHATSKWNGSTNVRPTLPLVIATINGKRSVISESSEVLNMLYMYRNQDWIYPTAESKKLEHFFGDYFGRPAFLVVYRFILTPEMKDSTFEILTRGTSRWQKLFCRLLWPTTRNAMYRLLRVKENFSANLAIVDEVFNLVNEKLAHSKYICGDSMCGADITFASLAYPLILPPEQDKYFYSRQGSNLPLEYIALVDKYRDTKAGQFVLELYANHRYKI